MSQAALDRQIRPIYDALDTGSNKSAIQACNKLLKKHPDLGLVKALKVLATVRNNKIEESLPLCDEVLASKPTDLDTLTAMMHVLRALGRHTDMVAMFDDAYKKQPTNEELGAQSFFANVRTGNWKAAQQIATRMHKQFKADRYLYWSVISAVLQGNDPTTPPPTRPILFKLAHRLLASATAPPHASADRLHLHLTVLRALGLHDDAHALLDAPEGRAVVKTSLVVDELRREFVPLRGAWLEEGERAVQKLQEGDRNWLEFLAVLDATLSHVAALSTPTTASDEARGACQAHITQTRELFAELADADGKRDRSALLAQVDLEWRARRHGLSSDSGALMTLLATYLDRFADKACCFEDLRPFVAFEGTELEQWATTLDAHEHISTSPADLQRSINMHKLRRHALTTAELTVDAEMQRAQTYLRAYTAALPLGANLPDTELQPADDFALLAAQTFVSLWTLSHDEAHLRCAVCVLEYASTRSKNSYLHRLHLVRLYRLLGAPAPAWQHYHAMSVKQMQSDTLSHFVLARASTFSLASTGDLQFPQECLESSQIYISNSSDTADYIVRAFASEKYSQIPDFISFEDRLDNSLQRDLIKIEHVRMRLTHEPVIPDVTDSELIELKFIFDRMHHDNRDFDVLPNYQPRSQAPFNEQTLMLGNSPGLGWLMTFLRVYIRVFQQASDLDDTVEEKLLIGDRPKVSDTPENRVPLKERLPVRKPEELGELTNDERGLFDYAMALCDWLAPYHDHARPPPAAVLAEATRLSDAKLGKTGKAAPAAGGENGSGSGNDNGSGSGNGDGNGDGDAAAAGPKKAEEPPAVKDAPEAVAQFFDVMARRFADVAGADDHGPCAALHVATLTQEALIILSIGTMRFKAASVVKINRLGALTSAFKELRTKGVAVLKSMSAALAKMAEREGTSERRKAFAASCGVLQQFPEFEHDAIMGVAKKATDARKRVLEGVAKGALRVCQHLP